jgi:putative transposase
MSRRARLSLPGIPWHIVQRSSARAVCFYAEDDYRFYLDLLARFSEAFGCSVHAYVLMTNHVHLLLTPSRQDSAASMMKHLGQRYAQYVNRTYRRCGTLWEGRFRSCLMQTEDYVLACYRYIELNPVRAGLVRHARAYRWSSYRANAEGQARSPLEPHAEYLRLGPGDAERQLAYRALAVTPLEASLLGEIRAATHGNYALGGERFQGEIEAALGRRARRGQAGRPRGQASEAHAQAELVQA